MLGRAVRPILLPLLAAVLGAIAVDLAVGQDFRIDTEILVGDQKKPAAESLTIFKGGVVYDFALGAQQEITIFDPVRGRFTLLDPARKWRTGLGSQAVLDYALQFDTEAAQSGNPVFAFAANPHFATSVDEYEENGQKLTRLTLAAQPLAYVAVARAADKPDAMAAYRQFADWYARLNTTRSGNLPTRARLELNKVLAERQLLPLEITRTIRPSGLLAREVTVKSRHLMNWTLSGEDHKRIERAGEYLATFQQVDFDEYRTAPPAAAQAATARR
jgi:hypothetical protein